MISNKLKAYNKLIRASNVYDVANVTPITKANTLSRQLKNNIFLKREDLQPDFSYLKICLWHFESFLSTCFKCDVVETVGSPESSVIR